MAKRASFDALVEEYEQTRDQRRGCIVCDSEHRDLIDELMRRGGGGPTIAVFLERRLNVRFSISSLTRHKAVHLDV